MVQWFYAVLFLYGLIIQFCQLNCFQNFGSNKMTKKLETNKFLQLHFLQSVNLSRNKYFEKKHVILKREVTNSSLTSNNQEVKEIVSNVILKNNSEPIASNEPNNIRYNKERYFNIGKQAESGRQSLRIKLKLKPMSENFCNTTISVKTYFNQHYYRTALIKNKQFKACRWVKIDMSRKFNLMSKNNSRVFNTNNIIQAKDLNILKEPNLNEKLKLQFMPKQTFRNISTTKVSKTKFIIIEHNQGKELNNIFTPELSNDTNITGRHQVNMKKRCKKCIKLKTLNRSKPNKFNFTTEASNTTIEYNAEKKFNEKNQSNTGQIQKMKRSITSNFTVNDNLTTKVFNKTNTLIYNHQNRLTIKKQFISKIQKLNEKTEIKSKLKNNCEAIIPFKITNSVKYFYKGELIKNKQFRSCKWKIIGKRIFRRKMHTIKHTQVMELNRKQTYNIKELIQKLIEEIEFSITLRNNSTTEEYLTPKPLGIIKRK